MKEIATLTVQDMMWVNLQVTKRQQAWNFATLEEAVYNQYSYGSSQDLLAQAARFVTGFIKLKPFPAGNEATAFVGLVGFLLMNGRDLHLTDEAALEWINGVWADGTVEGVKAKLEILVEDHDSHDDHGTWDVTGLLNGVLARYAQTVQSLVETGQTASIV
jgi:prophage maintenance system killer protein